MNEKLETEAEDRVLLWVVCSLLVLLCVFAAIGVAAVVNANWG